MPKFSKTSWHSKLYMFFYDDNYTRLPSNLCPYFWSLVGGSLLFFPAGLYIWITQSLFALIVRDKDKGGIYRSDAISYSVVVSIALALLFMLTAFIWTNNDKLSQGSLFLWSIIILTGLMMGARELVKKLKKNRRTKTTAEKKDNLFFSMIKAKKQKMCPKIEWGE